MKYFDDECLIKKYGTWVKVQVAFYDFIFEHGLSVHINCFNEKAFADGEVFYDESVEKIGKRFQSFETAWEEFKQKEKV